MMTIIIIIMIIIMIIMIIINEYLKTDESISSEGTLQPPLYSFVPLVMHQKYSMQYSTIPNTIHNLTQQYTQILYQ